MTRCSRSWENHSFAAVAAKNRSSHPKEEEEACDLTCRYSLVFLSPPAKRRRWEYSPLVLCSTRASSVSSPQSLRDEEAPSYVQQRHQALTRCVQTSFSLGKTLINVALSQPGKQPRAICSNSSINTQKSKSMRVFHTMHCPLSDGESGSIQTVLTNAGFNGFGNFSSTFGTAQYEGFPTLDSTVTPVLLAASRPASENHSRVRQSAQELEKPRDSQNRDSLGGSVLESHADDGRVLKGLGSDSNGQSYERCVASASDSQKQIICSC